MRRVAVVLFGVLAWCCVGFTQFQFGSVTGLVKDPSQAPVPGALVEIRSQTTNVARQATTSPAGEYNFVSLPADKYTITVRHPGFRDASRSFELSVVQSVDNDAGMLIFFPPVDAIREFKVQTSSAAAAYGGGAGVINVDIKSGTNGLHGAAYEFLRNSALDAKNFFDSHANPIPPFRLNQFGFNLGGPVVIPKVFNGRDKLFFFADYEGKRVYQAQTFTSTVPIAAFHTGDFSSLLPKTVIFDPRGNGHTPLANNIIPASAIDPTSAKLMALYPAQNLPGTTSNYLYNPGQQTTVDQFD